MKCNIGKTDRIIRVIIGIVIIAIGLLSHSWWGAIGILPILTAVFGFCGLYIPFKINTAKTTEEKKS
jgi:hypothetical protein